jgi:hypothetical protein
LFFNLRFRTGLSPIVRKRRPTANRAVSLFMRRVTVVPTDGPVRAMTFLPIMTFG